jgi:uncharacterized protein YqgC (DUF456 family)
MSIIAIAAMVGALLITPLGAPGLLLMVVVLGICTWLGYVSVGVLAACVVVALIAEGLEFVIMKKLTGRYGGSRRAFWGALAGGFIGVIIGAPVPIIGSMIAGFIGTFAGAAIVTWLELRDMGQAGRVGWGVLIGRMFAAGVKTAAGMIILVAGAAALLV